MGQAGFDMRNRNGRRLAPAGNLWLVVRRMATPKPAKPNGNAN